MITLTLNAGSSSLKFSVWVNHRPQWRGQFEQIGGRARLIVNGTSAAVEAPSLSAAFQTLRQLLADHEITPDVVGHRVVHGGEWYSRPTRLRATVIQRLQSITFLAPLHLPMNLRVIRLAQRAWPASQAWAVFDTAPYRDLPVPARSYALPPAIVKKYKIRKYGFHGTSHRWAFVQAAEKLGRPVKTLNAITVHLGAGTSITQWRRGQAIDTSMGFTPLAGAVMMTRTGDIDPMIPLYLQTHGGWSAAQVATLLNQESGLLGLTGQRDMRDVLQAAGHSVRSWPRRPWTAHQRRQAKSGLEIYIYSIQRYLASYLGVSSRLNAVIFTGQVGQNTTAQRLIRRGVTWPAQVRFLTVPTDEEQAIAAALRPMVR